MNVNNYRPISVLSQLNQIFERLISKRLICFFDQHSIISKKQFGFRKQHSTEHAILSLKEHIIENMNKGETTSVLFLDLKKAFDTVCHDILLDKLNFYGVRGVVHDLLASYLSNRYQYTVVRDAESDMTRIECGVPQGSVLGPLLFLIYINDLPYCTNMGTWLFADDTALTKSSRDLTALKEMLNYEASKVQDWLIANRLSIHYKDKTKYMLILAHSKVSILWGFQLQMGNNLIEKTDRYKYLGVIVDDKLKWDLHIEKMCSKLSSICGVISKARYYLDKKSLLLIYNCLVSSKLRYGTLCWSTAPQYLINKVNVLNNRIIRYINFKPIRTRLLPLYKRNNVLPLSEVIQLQRAMFMYNYHFNLLPNIFDNFFSIISHGYSTSLAATFNYSIPYCRTNREQSSIKYLGSKAWSDVPFEIKMSNTRKLFSTKIKKHLLTTDSADDYINVNNTNHQSQDVIIADLREIFEDSTDNGEFLGFENTSANIFENENDSLILMFDSDRENSEDFLGF